MFFQHFDVPFLIYNDSARHLGDAFPAIFLPFSRKANFDASFCSLKRNIHRRSFCVHTFTLLSCTHTHKFACLLSIAPTTPSPPAATLTNPKLPLNETNAALAHFDRMQFSLFYSFPFSPFLHLPFPLDGARWSYKIISKYMYMMVAYEFCISSLLCAQRESLAIFYFLFSSCLLLREKTLYQGASREGKILASIAHGSFAAPNCNFAKLRKQQ